MMQSRTFSRDISQKPSGFGVGRSSGRGADDETCIFDVLRFADADFDQSRVLSFRDKRVESSFREDLFRRGGHRQIIGLLVLIWLGFFLFEFFRMGIYTWLQEPDSAALVTSWSRVLTIALILACSFFVFRHVMHPERAVQVVIFVVPCLAILGDEHRMSVLLQSSHYQRIYSECSATSCFDDTKLIIAFLSCGILPQLLSVRLACCYHFVPFSCFLYGATSLTGLGPSTPAKHAAIVAMYLAITLCIFVGTYRFERDLRTQWVESVKLKLQHALSSVQFQRHREWALAVQERVDTFEASCCLDMQKLYARGPMADEEVFVSKGTVPSLASSRRVDLPASRPSGRFFPSVLAAVEARAGGSEVSSPIASESTSPNKLLSEVLAGRSMDAARLRRMAKSIYLPSYGLREFFDDAVATFPELSLFSAVPVQHLSSGHSAEVEYQRTIGALFAVYWLLRLDIDGKEGFSFGYEDSWKICDRPAGHNCSKQLAFYKEMEWEYFAKVASEAIEGSSERLQAMLCLTAIHDIMKVQALCPVVEERHAPYHGYAAGEVINDHDLALAYVLDKFPDLLPSYRALPEASRETILFTQGKMHFNHGWFVQAEAPPGPMLSGFKAALYKARPSDLAFYFLHWLTDLSGAEGRPLAGAEKFVLRFSRSVLSSFLWSIPFLQCLVGPDKSGSETSVVEKYLEARFQLADPEAPLPKGPSSVALMRLAVMSQNSSDVVAKAWESLPPQAKQTLSIELSRTGIRGQRFANSPQAGGPALYVYYGPALLQHCSSSQEMLRAMLTLAAVYRAARSLWPLSLEQEGHSVSLEAGSLKANAAAVVAGSLQGSVLVLERRSRVEGVISPARGRELNSMLEKKGEFCMLEVEDVDWNFSCLHAEVVIGASTSLECVCGRLEG